MFNPERCTGFFNKSLDTHPVSGSGLEDVIEKYQPGLWIHGHTHVACDYQIYGTRGVCNPRGSPAESPDSGFLPGLVVGV